MCRAMIYDINNLAVDVASKYYSVYPYTFRIFKGKVVDQHDNYFVNSVPVADQLMMFKSIKSKYLAARGGMVDDLTWELEKDTAVYIDERRTRLYTSNSTLLST
jgi:hypothetical protein